MKKIVSIFLAVLMSLLSVSALADFESSKPARISYDVTDAKIAPEATKVDTTGVEVTSNVDTANGFGAPNTIFDGIGMIDGASSGNDWSGDNENRWTTSTNTAFTLTINFNKDVTFSTIKFTEIRKVIEKYEITGYKDGVEVKKISGSLTDGSTTSVKTYLRTIELDGNIVVDSIAFSVTPYTTNNKVISISEMELWAEPVSVSCNVEKLSTAKKEISAIVDGTGMDTTVQNWDYRWGCNKNTSPEITFIFSEDVTFNEIKFYEVRREISKCTVTCYNGDEKVLDTYVHTFTDGAYTGTGAAQLRSVELPKVVTADKVVFKVTEQYASNVISIQEMEFWNSVKAPAITDAEGTAVAPQTNGTPVINMFDGAYTIDGSANGKFGFVAFDSDSNYAAVYKTPITISFDLGSQKTFNYAELAELRCILGDIDVYVSSDGDKYTKVGTMPKMDYNGSTAFEAIHSVSFNPVTARFVKYVINEMAAYDEIKNQGSQVAVTINEISLYNFPEISEEAVVYPVYARGAAYNIDDHSYVNANSNITIKNDTNAPKEYILIGAAYYADGTLSNVYKNDFTVEANTTRTFTQYVAADENTIKIFVWDKNITPIIESSSLVKTPVE